MAVNRLRLKYRVDAVDKRAEAIKRIVANPDRLLGVVLLGVTFAEISAASLPTYAIAAYAAKDRAEVISLIASVLAFLIPVRICVFLLSPFTGRTACCSRVKVSAIRT